MKYTTLNDIMTLKEILNQKRDMIKAYERFAQEQKDHYHTMTDRQLKKAIKEVQEAEADIAKEKLWCEKAEAKIREFYKPAMAM